MDRKATFLTIHVISPYRSVYYIVCSLSNTDRYISVELVHNSEDYMFCFNGSEKITQYRRLYTVDVCLKAMPVTHFITLILFRLVRRYNTYRVGNDHSPPSQHQLQTSHKVYIYSLKYIINVGLRGRFS